MALQPIFAVPGLCLVNSDYASGKQFGFVDGRGATGRYTAGDNVEFIAGFPQKVGGYSALVSSGIVGTPRALRSWRSATGAPLLAIGTETHLYSWDGTNLTDVTPLAAYTIGTLGTTNPLTTTNGSRIIAVADTANHLQEGDHVLLDAGTNGNGVIVDGWFQVSSVTGTGYNITLPIGTSPATASGVTGGSVTFKYPRGKLGAAPFATTTGSNVVTVTDASGFVFQKGQYVSFSGATVFNNVTISGEYQIQSETGSTYTILSATNATGTGTGGGSAVLVAYNVFATESSFGTGIGYGTGPYGFSGYGASSTSAQQFPSGFTLAPYGNLMTACAIGDTIFIYDPSGTPSTNNRAFPMLNAPANCTGHFITPERFVVALGAQNLADGSAGSLITVAWCDQNDFTQWVTTPTNTANTARVLQGGDYFVGGLAVRDGVSLVWTNRCTFQMNYTGDFLVYDTPLIADNAGLVSPFSAIAQGGSAYWMGDTDFWYWNGSVSPLPTDDVRDFVFSKSSAFPGINPVVSFKCSAGSNRLKRQVRFFYPSRQATENDSYLIFQVDQQVWGAGSRQVTAWTDAELSSTPFGADASPAVYYEETGVDANGVALNSSLTFSPVDVSNGEANVDFFGFIPDFQRITGVQTLTVDTRYYPEDQNVTATFTLTPPTGRVDLRGDGKMIGWQIDSNAIGADYRIGLHRVDLQPSGARH